MNTQWWIWPALIACLWACDERGRARDPLEAQAVAECATPLGWQVVSLPPESPQLTVGRCGDVIASQREGRGSLWRSVDGSILSLPAGAWLWQFSDDGLWAEQVGPSGAMGVYDLERRRLKPAPQDEDTLYGLGRSQVVTPAQVIQPPQLVACQAGRMTLGAAGAGWPVPSEEGARTQRVGECHPRLWQSTFSIVEWSVSASGPFQLRVIELERPAVWAYSGFNPGLPEGRGVIWQSVSHEGRLAAAVHWGTEGTAECQEVRQGWFHFARSGGQSAFIESKLLDVPCDGRGPRWLMGPKAIAVSTNGQTLWAGSESEIVRLEAEAVGLLLEDLIVTEHPDRFEVLDAGGRRVAELPGPGRVTTAWAHPSLGLVVETPEQSRVLWWSLGRSQPSLLAEGEPGQFQVLYVFEDGVLLSRRVAGGLRAEFVGLDGSRRGLGEPAQALKVVARDGDEVLLWMDLGLEQQALVATNSTRHQLRASACTVEVVADSAYQAAAARLTDVMGRRTLMAGDWRLKPEEGAPD